MENQLTLTTSTKLEVATRANQIIMAVQEGGLDALKAKVICKGWEQLAKQVQDGIDYYALNAATNYGAKTFDVYGASVQMKETGVRYDYSECGDKEWEKLTDQINALTAKRKELEKVLAAHHEKWVKTDIITGEVYEVMPPVRYGKESLAITLK